MQNPSHRAFKLHLLDEDTKETLKLHFEELEKTLDMPGLGYTLFYVVLELVSNAVRANLKRYYFRHHGFSLSEPESYQRGLECFKRDYNTIGEKETQRALEELDFQVTISVDLNSERLLIFVENNMILLEEEEKRIRTKLASAMDVKDLIEFSVLYGDETEGKGLGLAMIVLLIKDLGLNPGNFRVFRKSDRTIARLEFPLLADYKPLRERSKIVG